MYTLPLDKNPAFVAPFLPCAVSRIRMAGFDCFVFVTDSPTCHDEKDYTVFYES